jgi:hypothetical protein
LPRKNYYCCKEAIALATKPPDASEKSCFKF